MNPFTRNESSSSIAGDQFKNTQVWDQVVYAFCLGVPVSRHRRRFRTYSDCFVSKCAVDWLHKYLKKSQHFNQVEVSRFQALQLLRKFHKYDIIVRADGKGNFDREFDDNSELYRLSQAALDKLPVMKPNDEENRMPSLTNRLSSNSLALHNASLTTGPYMGTYNPLATIRTTRSVRRSYSNVSSLRPCDLPQLNCCVNAGFNDSLSDERTPLRSVNQSSLQPVLRPHHSNVNMGLYKSPRLEQPANVFWL